MAGIEGLINEECGIIGVSNIPYSSKVAIEMLWTVQHRGRQGAGCVSSQDNMLSCFKGSGPIINVFPTGFDYSSIQGNNSLSHVRYSTKGSMTDTSNVQPFVVKKSKFGEFALAHNGQLRNSEELHQGLIDNGGIFQSNSDSELIAHIMSLSKSKNIEGAIIDFMSMVESAYSIVILNNDTIFAFRDKFGIRLLSYTSLNEGNIISSETCTFEGFSSIDNIIDIKPGELVVFEPNKSPRHLQVIPSQMQFCIFEAIYFSDPRSHFNKVYHEDFRHECGKQVYYENKDFFDKLKLEYKDNLIVVPILDSGIFASEGFEKASGIPILKAFMRRHYSPGTEGRSYMESSHVLRREKAYKKLSLRPDFVEGKAVITIDDSIVRGNTGQVNNDRLYDAGAVYVCNVSASSMILNTCGKGVDHQDSNELIAVRYHGQITSDMTREMHCDSIIYLTKKTMLETANKIYGTNLFCSNCFQAK
jgi:amidophosphoribosyltransferase